jgi:hypothetical protein
MNAGQALPALLIESGAWQTPDLVAKGNCRSAITGNRWFVGHISIRISHAGDEMWYCTAIQ